MTPAPSDSGGGCCAKARTPHFIDHELECPRRLASERCPCCTSTARSVRLRCVKHRPGLCLDGWHDFRPALVRLDLSERELSAINFAASVVRGVEAEFSESPQVGIREGEATSDVLAGIVSRAQRPDLPASEVAS